MEKHTNIYQCPQSCYEQLLLESQKRETNEKPHFTLMRFLIVLAILGFLSVVVPSVYYLTRCGPPRSKDITLIQLANIDAIIGQYLLDMRQYPKTLDEFIENKNNHPNWIGPYLKKSQLKDGWGNSFQYRYPGRHQDYELYSYGADGQLGGEGDNADIGNWELIKE
jgi:general secretion pathway protein G